MNHVTEIISTQQVSDEAIAVKIRCCDNPLTDSVHTLYGVAKMSALQLEQIIDAHHNRVALKHQGMASGKHLLDTVISKTKIHEAV